MKLKPEELAQHGYSLLDKLEHTELVPFVRTYIRKRTIFSMIYYCCNIISVALIIFYFIKFHGTTGFSIGKGFSYLSYGLAITFLLIPLHEYIHALAYKSQGAKQTSYDMHLKKFYFLAMADQFVVNKREFQIVALAPFVIISSLSIIGLFFVDSLWIFAMLGILLMHTACCSGDFAMLSYFDFHKDKTVVTYDDKENKISYFYSK